MSKGRFPRTYFLPRFPLDTSPSKKGLSQHSVAHPHVSGCLLRVYSPTWEIAIRFTVLKNYLWGKYNDLTDILYCTIPQCRSLNMTPSQYHHPPSILRSYFHKLVFTFLPHYFLSSKLAPPLHKTNICAGVSYPSCGLHVQHFTTSAMLCRTYTFNNVSLRSILKYPLRLNTGFWFSRDFFFRTHPLY